MLVAGIAALGMVFSNEIVELYAPAFHKVPGKFELTVQMTQLMFPFFPLVALAAAFMAVLNACGSFFIPGFSSALFNVASVGVGAALAWILPSYGIQSIVGMAIGVVVGGAVQAFSQWPELRKQGYRFPARDRKDAPPLREPALRAMLLMMIPGTIGLAATQINILVNSMLATSQGPGAVSWLNYAFRLMQFPIGVFGVSLAAATLPRVSELWVKGDRPAVANQVNTSLRQVLAINLPASAGLAVLGPSIIQMLFEYGNFGPWDTRATAQALAAYSLGLAAYSAVKVLVPVCYAIGNTRIPVIGSLLSVALTIALNVGMVGSLGFAGLALGTSIAAVFNAVYLWFSVRAELRRRATELVGAPVLSALIGYGALSIVMAGVVWAADYALRGWIPEATLSDWGIGAAVPGFRVFRTLFLVALGGGVALVTARAMGLAELQAVSSSLSRRLGMRQG